MKELIINSALKVSNKRKDIHRQYGEPLSKKNIDKLLHLAMLAPEDSHLLPWNFILVNDQTQLKGLSAALPDSKNLDQTGTGIVVCVETDKEHKETENFAIQDGNNASRNITLAAQVLKLFTTCVSIYPNEVLMNFIRKKLNLPSSIIPIKIILASQAVNKEMVKTKLNFARVYWEHLKKYLLQFLKRKIQNA